ncbi:MAG TPA: hypothetical protein VIA62_11515 [Thermoanaerobaculia bacterium]|jgi:hypothetical protein|nr:hypothetical protein [Thermoanaerobaculia bacterium]
MIAAPSSDATSPFTEVVGYDGAVRARRHLRTTVVLFLAVAPLLFLGSPLCFSRACSMSAAERVACKRMGRECCGTRGGQISQAPAAPAPALAASSAWVSLTVPVPESVSFDSSSRPVATPAVTQGVGLFTLFAVFLI